MTEEQEQHLEELQDEFDARLDDKYRRGQKEHGANLFDLDAEDLLEEAIDECIDQYTYLKTALDQVRALKSRIEDLEEELAEK